MARKEIKEEADAEKAYQAELKGAGQTPALGKTPASKAALDRSRKRLALLKVAQEAGDNDPRTAAEIYQLKAWLTERGA